MRNSTPCSAIQGVRHPLEGTRGLCVLLEATDVVAGTEHRPGLAFRVGPQHQHPNRRVGIDLGELPQQGVQVGILQAVAVRWPVQRDGGHAVLHGQQGGG